MRLAGLLPLVQQSTPYTATLKKLWTPQGGDSALSLHWPLLDAARPAVLGALQQDWIGPLLVLTSQPERAHFLQEQVAIWSVRSPSWYVPAPDALFYDRTPWDGDTIHRRASVLSALAHQDYSRPPIIFMSIWALMTRTIPVEILRRSITTLKVGQTARVSDLAQALVEQAYEPVPVVEEAGTFAQRGGILDVFPPNADQPVRLEWYGDQVETLRYFDPLTQRSLQTLDQLTLYPASEALARYEPALKCLSHLPSQTESPALARWQRDRERLAQNSYFRGAEFYLACLFPRPASVLDYLPPHVLLVIDDMSAVEDAAHTLEQQAMDIRAELVASGQLPEDFPSPYLPWDELGRSIASLPGIHLGHIAPSIPRVHLPEAEAVGELPLLAPDSDSELHDPSPVQEDPPFHLPPAYGGRVEHMVEDTMRLRSEKQRVVIVSRQAQRLSNLFAEHGESLAPVEDVMDLPGAGSLTLVQGSLAEGWSLREPAPRRSHLPVPHTPMITLLSDAEIFGWARPKRRSFTRKKAASPESFFSELHSGDHVVHIDHGIGIYRGLVQRTVEGTVREYLELEYAEGDRVYVPVSQIDRVSRYVGGSDQPPSIHRLGSTDWIQARSRAQKAVQDIARELLALYAARSVVPGHAFSPDVLWQEELEASFPYEETEDQLRALAEVKADMENSRPMDRLICGDVGYGKTEVAVRAAFKAVMDGKQVAVLVPTTVLAQQHLLTFQQRLSAFPVRVTMLSRFCSPQEERIAVDGLREGTVDVVVGTHRLLQKDITFKDLGLLIVDEEQRFGVRHKEWLKRMRQQVDVLTLSATPIPRTLYMAMSGVRDMSTIDTPPEERLPIRTQVSEYDEGVIRRAVLRELNRGGQVYFVHNRVQGIRQIAQRLQKVIPEASIAIGHGQMPEDKLSGVMMDFGRGDYDVLTCTSIIESGLDIPNVNTIIINRADQFGLAQLYQLRGRVGRSAAQAYAYFLHERRLRLSEVARRRLEAILEASELGAGFRIAMRDLEIRGAGEILGASQHGHIAAIGFELYTRLLAQAVDTMKKAPPESGAELPPVELPPVIELPLQACLPEDYVPEEDLRIRLYQRMTSLQSEEQLDSLHSELEDRFGLLPSPTENLLYVLRVRLLASRAGVLAVGRADNNLVLKLNAQAQGRASAMASQFGRRAWVGRGQMWLALAEGQGDWQEILLALLQRLGRVTPDTRGTR
jgi:transcription-repair coupling factor (superfamily II helicase)